MSRALDRVLRRRPVPPQILLNRAEPRPLFIAAPELGEFARFAFLSETSPLYNPDHKHLRRARIGYLYTNAVYKKQQHGVAGEASLPTPHRALSGWAKSRADAFLWQLFGVDPKKLDFIITLYALAAASYDDASFCALFEHEHYHCAQRRILGVPQFVKSTGRPKFCILGHDVEEFTGIVARYGVEAAGERAVDFVNAARRRPLISAAKIARACGTCKAA